MRGRVDVVRRRRAYLASRRRDDPLTLQRLDVWALCASVNSLTFRRISRRPLLLFWLVFVRPYLQTALMGVLSQR